MSDEQIKEMIFFMLTDLANHGALNYPFAWIVNSSIEIPPKIMSKLLSTVKECIKDSKSSEIMDGTLVTYSGFTQSDRVHLTIEVGGHLNYIANNLNKGDKIQLKKCTTP